MKQKVSQLESELSEKDKKWKSASTEKDAEISKKLTDYKEKVIFYFIQIRKLEQCISEKDKEIIRVSAESEKSLALAEQKLQYTTSKLQDLESKSESLNQDSNKAKEKLADNERLIIVHWL